MGNFNFCDLLELLVRALQFGIGLIIEDVD